jgi:hypothetical protein
VREVLSDSSMTIKSGATRTADKKAYQTKTDLPMDLPLVNVLFSYEVLPGVRGEDLRARGKPGTCRHSRDTAEVL